MCDLWYDYVRMPYFAEYIRYTNDGPMPPVKYRVSLRDPF